jgi:hypothetical protein
MLRRRLGDADFLKGLSRFYRDNRFRTASWTDLEDAFQPVSSQDLGGYFDAWTTRVGAPRLALQGVAVEQTGDGFRVSGRLEQQQEQPPFPLMVPLLIHQENGPAVTLWVNLDDGTRPFAVDLPSEPVRLAVDPGFDTFRELLPGESPAALSNLFGAEAGLIVLPEKTAPALLEGYRALADAWTKGHPGWRVTTDAEVRQPPKDGAVWVLGWNNRFAARIGEGAHGFELRPEEGELVLDEHRFSRSDVSPALTRAIDGQPWGWLAAPRPEALPGLARKLPHYGKYGYLVFAGDEPKNILKGQWPPGDSALAHWFGETHPELGSPPEAPLTPLLDGR